MVPTYPLSECFIPLLQTPNDAAFCQTLEKLLVGTVAAGESGWPQLKIPAADFVRYVARRIDHTKPILGEVARLHTSDLYLACACASGNSQAILAFDNQFGSELERLLARRVGRERFEEIRQRIRTKLFVGTETRAPKISEFSGRGELRTWFRILAIRELVSANRVKPRAGGDPEVPTASVSTWVDPERVHLQARHAPECEEILTEVIAKMPTADRTILRYYYVDGLNIDQLGAIFGVHRVTAARRVNRARQDLVDCVHTMLKQTLEMNSFELESMLNQIRSAIQVSLQRLLSADFKAKVPLAQESSAFPAE